MTSVFDVKCAAQLRNARLSDDRPIRQFSLIGTKAYAIERSMKKVLVFFVLRLVGGVFIVVQGRP
jgi:hypothetical protein